MTVHFSKDILKSLSYKIKIAIQLFWLWDTWRFYLLRVYLQSNWNLNPEKLLELIGDIDSKVNFQNSIQIHP
jgi:hypothetical protein